MYIALAKVSSGSNRECSKTRSSGLLILHHFGQLCMQSDQVVLASSAPEREKRSIILAQQRLERFYRLADGPEEASAVAAF